MYTLSDAQIEFILDDIRRDGIELEDLQLNLLDHICCIIELELEANGDFEHFYQQVKRKFYKHKLAELEEETQLLLTFKHYYTMKKLMIGSGIFAASVFSLGIFFKFMYWPGASFMVVIGIALFSLLFLPLYFTLKIKEEKSTRDKILVGLTSIITIDISLAVLFKIMHWPGANVMGLLAVVLLGLVFLPLYLITGIRNPETKVNTIVSSVMIVAGCGLFLSLARSPRATKMQDEMLTAYIVRNEQLLELQKQLSPIQPAKPGNYLEVGGELIRICEQLKANIVQVETGSLHLTPNFNQTSQYISNGSIIDYFIEGGSMYQDYQQLRQLVDQYNQQVQQLALTPIPSQILTMGLPGETTSGALNNLQQLEQFVLLNQQFLHQ
ncbi:MAG: hypothetical protein EAY81_09855 [Bacteroidetes bacterium]|nr:MAG: hypothetical protein EAY81_09855 [Bacteroidota bacterium]